MSKDNRGVELVGDMIDGQTTSSKVSLELRNPDNEVRVRLPNTSRSSYAQLYVTYKFNNSY